MNKDKNTGRKPAEIYIALPRRSVVNRIDMAQTHSAVVTIATSFDAAKHLLSNIPNRRGPRFGPLDQS